MRWMSPELLAPSEYGFKTSRPTKSSDCYALGMVIYETISGNIPFHEALDMAVFLCVVKGERPRREAGFTDDLWKMTEQCWAPQPDDRPSIEGVLHCLETSSNSTSSTDAPTNLRPAPSKPKLKRSRKPSPGPLGYTSAGASGFFDLPSGSGSSTVLTTS